MFRNDSIVNFSMFLSRFYYVQKLVKIWHLPILYFLVLDHVKFSNVADKCSVNFEHFNVNFKWKYV